MENWIPGDDQLREMLGLPAEGSEKTQVEETVHVPAVEYKEVVFEEMMEGARGSGEGASLDLVLDVVLPISVRLGSVEMPLGKVASLKEGSIICLERLAGEMVDVFIGDELVAKGDVVVTVDKYGLVIKDIVEPRERVRSQEKHFSGRHTNV